MTLVFDTETTGKADFAAPPEAKHQPRLVQIGAILLDDQYQVRAELNMIVKPDGYTIPDEASAVHKITQDIALKYGIAEFEVLNTFACLLRKSTTLVAHNIRFDAIVIGRAFAEYTMVVPPPANKFCTMEATTNICKLPGGYGGKFKWPKLEEAYWHLFSSKFESAHDAMADVRACARIYKHLKSPEPKKPVEVPRERPPLDTDPDPEEAYNDDTPMPFGKHKGRPLSDVPADYFHWLYTNGDGCRHRQIKTYIESNKHALQKECPDKIW